MWSYFKKDHVPQLGHLQVAMRLLIGPANRVAFFDIFMHLNADGVTILFGSHLLYLL
jgi:hypothetical protein